MALEDTVRLALRVAAWSGLAILSTSCALVESSIDSTPPHTIDVEALGDDVLRPVPLLSVIDEMTEEEMFDRLEALQRGEPVPPNTIVHVRPPEVLEATRFGNEFVIFEGLQSGRYTFDAWLGGPDAPESGVLWLRAIDADRGTILSEETIRDSTRTSVSPPDDGGYLYVQGSDNNVTIYEGQLGDPYVVRFEMWHKANDSEPVLLAAESYLIEGWEH